MGAASLDITCILALVIGLGVIALAYGPLGSFSRWLGAKSRIDPRTAAEEGVPFWITGNFERLLAFSLVVFHVEGAFTLIALWLGAKLAASWHRVPAEPYAATEVDYEKFAENREYNRQIRAGTLCALIAGIVSVLIGAFAGLIVRNVCHCCVLN